MFAILVPSKPLACSIDDDGQPCTMASGCPGTTACINRQLKCMCAVPNDGYVAGSCTPTSTPAPGCQVKFTGTLTCNTNCAANCSANTSGTSSPDWTSTTAFWGDAMRGWTQAQCGGGQGSCPFVDSATSHTYNLEHGTSKPTEYTPANPFDLPGCANGSAPGGCRFAPVDAKSLNNLNVRLVKTDHTNGGVRNELAEWKENCLWGSHYAGLTYNASNNTWSEVEQDRYYVFSLYLPDLGTPPTQQHKGGAGVFQFHEIGQCMVFEDTNKNGPYMILSLAKTDTSSGPETGSAYQFTLERRIGGYSLNSSIERVLPSSTTTAYPVSEGAWTHIVVHKYWSKYACGSSCNFAQPSGGATEVWIIEPTRTRRWADGLEPTLWTFPSSDLCSSEQTWWSRDAGGQVMPIYAKLGLYGDAETPDTSVKFHQFRVGQRCADVWDSAWGPACPR